MCDLEYFLRRAGENKDFAGNHCLSNDDVWAVVIYGYSAILLVNAIVKKYKWEPENHEERWRLLNDLGKRLPRLREVRAPYNYIFHRCRDGRYRPNCGFTPDEINEVQKAVNTIEKIIKPLVRARV